MSQTVLILGATGRFGRHAATAFEYAGWTVRCFDRASDSLWDAAWGADVIVNAWNPKPHNWADTQPGLTKQVIEVAQASGATVIIPGNVYAYGDKMPPILDAATPQRPTTPYGEIRATMEASYRAAGVRTIVLRAGDFIDVTASGNWFDKVIMAKVAQGKVAYPGPLDRPHAWAFLPDMAEAAVLLAEQRATLAPFEDVPFAGFTLTGAELIAAASQAAGRPLRATGFPWWAIRLARPFWPEGGYLADMRYLWDRPHGLSGEKLARLCPQFRATPVVEALRDALEIDVHPDQPVGASRVPLFTQKV